MGFDVNGNVLFETDQPWFIPVPTFRDHRSTLDDPR